MGLEIIPVNCGTMGAMPKPLVTFPYGFGQVVEEMTVYMFVIKGGPDPIVVDTGPPDPEWIRKYHAQEFKQTKEQSPEAALKNVGVDPREVKTVIFTHLHWDHCFNNHLFANARFYVQKKELCFAIDPPDIWKGAYEKLPELAPPWIRGWDRFVAIEGETEIAAGVSVVPLPGHTPGLQGLLVHAEHNKYVLASDAVNTYENWLGNERTPHIIGGIHTDVVEFEQTMKKIENLERQGYIVIPGHDKEVQRQIFK